MSSFSVASIAILAALLTPDAQAATNEPIVAQLETSTKGTPRVVPSVAKPAGVAKNSQLRILRNGQLGIDLCDGTSPCVTGAMPAQVGTVNAVVMGDFVSKHYAAASWITVSDKQSSLCYFATNRHKKISCVPIKAPVLKDVKIRHVRINGVNALVFDSTGARSKIGVTPVWKAVEQYTRALDEAIARTSKQAARRVSGPSLPMEHVEDEDEKCDALDCAGNGDYYENPGPPSAPQFPDAPDKPIPDEPESPADNSGDVPPEHPDRPDEPDGGGWPPSPSDPLNDSGGSRLACRWDGPFLVCIHISPRPDRDPLEPPLPPPIDERPWYCRWFGLFCPGTPAYEPVEDPASPDYEPVDPEPSVPPYVPRPINVDGRPLAKYSDGYEEALDRCDALYEINHETCQADYAMRAGGLEGLPPESLTVQQRRDIRKAKSLYEVCMRRAGNDLDDCYTEARDKHRIND